MKSEYLLFNVIVALGPLISVFFVTNMRRPQLLPTLIALVSVALGYIVWDSAVTGIFWTFNPAYTLGPRIGGIPFEEALFFVTVPFGCLVLWVNWPMDRSTSPTRVLVPLTVCIVSFLLALTGYLMGWYYTASVGAMICVLVLIDYVSQVRLLRGNRFPSFALLVLLLTFVFNLYLTARPIVLYNNEMKSNINLFTIPGEDFVYGLALIFSVLVAYELATRAISRSSQR